MLTKLFYNRNDINTLNIPNTLGVDVKPVTLHRDDRKLRLNVWDCAGNEKYKGLGKEYYKEGNLLYSMSTLRDDNFSFVFPVFEMKL